MNQPAQGAEVATRAVPPPRADVDDGSTAVEAAFQSLPPRLFAAGARLTPPGGETIVRLRRGWAIQPFEWPDGRRAIVDVYLPGDIIGIDAALGQGSANPVLAVTPVTTQAIDGGESQAALLSNRYALLYLARVAAGERRRAHRLAAMIARLDAPRRLAALLLDFADRLHGDAEAAGERSYHLPLTQQQLGDHLGLTVVHVNRVLRQLRRQRLIELDRHIVVLRDRQLLARLVAGDAPPAPSPTSIRRLPGRAASPRLVAAEPLVASAG